MADRTTRVLEGTVFVSVPLAGIAAMLDSYLSQVDVAAIVANFGWFESHLYPLTIDFTLGGSIAAWWLLARWGAPRRPQFWLGLMIVGSAIATVSANALHGWVASNHADIPWFLRAVVSAVPGLAIVAVTHQAVLVARHRPGQERAEARASDESRDVPKPRTRRSTARANGAPKVERVHALLQARQDALADEGERAEAIREVAREARASIQYVRKIARAAGAPASGKEVAA